MSEYCHRKAVRMKISLEEARKIFEVDDKWDIMDYLENTKFEVAPSNQFFIDYNLPCNYYGDGDWGKSRELYPVEYIKYASKFRELLKGRTVKPYELRLVEYSWYDGVEAPDYFDESTCHDDFYDEV